MFTVNSPDLDVSGSPSGQEAKARIRIVVADDQQIMRKGLCQLLAQHGDLAVVAEAADGAETLDLLTRQDCDLLLLGVDMPGLRGVELISCIHQSRPGLPILILSAQADSRVALSLLKSGAAGYLSKDAGIDELLAAIRKAADGGRVIAPELAVAMVFASSVETDSLPHQSLSEREMLVLRRLAQGWRINEIALDLAISPKTVATYKMRLMKKLRVSSNAMLFQYALKHGLN
jgi:DNA-binding NarL/FixJ family response regulator